MCQCVVCMPVVEPVPNAMLAGHWDRGFDAGYAAAKAEAWVEKARAWDEGFHAHEVGEFLTDNPWRKTHE